jgi:hypothetical protein
LVTHFNYPFGVFNNYTVNGIGFKSKWFAKVLSGHHERKFGCDSMLIFKVNNKIKIGLFEAKWPRILKNPSYQWDYTQKSTKTSHFTDQINRQSRWSKQAAIWEMFLLEEKVGVSRSPFDNNASSCVKHIYAKNMIDKNSSLQTLWNNFDLINLIKSEQTLKYNGTNETNLKSIIFDILTCSFGEAIEIHSNDRTFNLISIDKEEKITCPIIQMENEDENNYIENFMDLTNLSFLQQIDISFPNNYSINSE